MIEKFLTSFSDAETKLVIGTYDGTALMAGEQNGFQIRLKEREGVNMMLLFTVTKRNLVPCTNAEKVNGVKIYFAFSQLSSICIFEYKTEKCL